LKQHALLIGGARFARPLVQAVGHSLIERDIKHSAEDLEARLAVGSIRDNYREDIGGDGIVPRGTVARFNVSRNDGSRIIQIAGIVSGALIDRNVIHVGAALDARW
jgi:hypothetical protein